ncbi:MAG: ABC transporter C-terminal domain-containing protein, partial [Gemmatimonadaceae bacterium]
FADWEIASAERANAAAVTATEEEQRRRVQERRMTRQRHGTQRPDHTGVRARQRAMDEAEAGVERLDARVAALTKALEAPDLYTTADGTTRALALGAELDAARRALDEAFARWEGMATGE